MAAAARKETDKAVQINRVTGLTVTQEKACSLLASGRNPSEVAGELGIPEKTIYLWQKKPTFICYYNKRRSVIRDVARQSVFGLVDDAVAALRDSLSSTNEAVRLKAATYVIDKLQDVEVGDTDIVAMVKAEATYSEEWLEQPELHEKEYRAKLKELGVTPETEADYQNSLK